MEKSNDKAAPKVMVPTKELLELAKRKASGLGENQIIRLGGAEYEKSYWVLNVRGKHFIGSTTDEPLQNFFTKRKEIEITTSFTTFKAQNL
jgi:hypothetical protein